MGLLMRLCEGLQALQQARPNIDGVNCRPGRLAGTHELASVGRLDIIHLHTRGNIAHPGINAMHQMFAGSKILPYLAV